MLSPGVPHTISQLQRARDKGTKVIGEIELASKFIDQPIVAITGTNGKTTTTTLLGDMLLSSGFKVFVGGNIGNPLIGYVETNQVVDLVVAEISSFQLDTIKHFRPRVSVLLNISEDHLDRYSDFDAYAKSKMRIFENQQANDIAVLNGADTQVVSRTGHIKCQKLIYPNPQSNENGAFLADSHITLIQNNAKRFSSHFRIPHSAFRIRQSVDTAAAGFLGRHNLENACAAVLAALAAGATVEGIQTALNQFQGSAHRLEYIDTINAARYFNDSKATNVEAVVRALECFSQPVILIMGGRDKADDFKALGDAVRKHAKALIVMGEAASAISSALDQIIPATSASSMQDAVRKANEAAAPGEIVLLSPACASFDMYDNYAQRGDDFRNEVKKLKKTTVC